MSGNKAGAQRTKQTLIDQLGEEGYKEWMAARGRTGGKSGRGSSKGFANRPREAAVEAGKIGGKASAAKRKQVMED